MNLFFLQLLPNKPAAPAPAPPACEQVCDNGSREFFNKVIHVSDWPVMRTEESIAPGSPENVW